MRNGYFVNSTPFRKQIIKRVGKYIGAKYLRKQSVLAVICCFKSKNLIMYIIWI